MNHTVSISPLLPEMFADFQEHFRRHHLESGADGYHFMPFIPGDRDRPKGMDADKLLLDLDEKGWQRGWVAVDADSGRVVGHVNLKGPQLKTMLHRCELGLGIESAYRGRGLGRRLMQTALDFARQQKQIQWVDLCTFGTNTTAQALYRSLGFQDAGLIPERFLINGQAIDDIQMVLCVRNS